MADLQAHYDRETRRLVRILRRLDPERIIRFGSASRENLNPDSDLDLCILIERRLEEPSFRLKQRLFKFLFQRGYRYPVPVDLHVYTPAEFLERLARGDPFVQEIVQGEVIYDREWRSDRGHVAAEGRRGPGMRPA